MSRWNPTEEEVAEYRRARQLASARSRTQALIDENRALLAERDRLLGEIAALKSEPDDGIQTDDALWARARGEGA